MARCCTDLIKFILFFVNFLFFLVFAALLACTIYVLLNAENTLIGTHIEPSFSKDNPTATYFSFIIIFIVVFAFLSLFTCLGCCGAAYKSGCMLGSFIVILFVLFGGAVGAVIFLHTQYGKDGVREVLVQEMAGNLQYYSESNVLTFHFWNFLQERLRCCGVAATDDGPAYNAWDPARSSSIELPTNYKVPEECCREADCSYEPNNNNTFMDGCADKILLYVQVVFYGIPVAMFISLVFAFVVSSQIGRASSRVKAARDAARAGGGAGYSGYSSGCEEEFHHYTAGEQNNAPYNPHYEQELRSRMETAGFNVPGAPPQAHVPLLHEAPPTYHEAVFRRQ